jgi:FkbM family methyltransferase
VSDPAALYARYLKPGDLVFDIGANVGLRTAVFLEMGLRVVAVEPQPWCLAQIDELAVRIEAAAGAVAGMQTMICSRTQDYLSTLNHAMRELQPASDDYPDRLAVAVVTLDSLIAEYGVPAFTKIDVEGYEDQVLQGLSSPLRALSFEVHPFDPGKTDACLARLAALGDYALSYSDRESFEMEAWPAEVGMFGDIYAELA